MGLASDISTLEARVEAGQNVADELALAYAEMVTRKSSKRLVWAFFDSLKRVMENAGRYDELIQAGGGADPACMGVWDCQNIVVKWLDDQHE